MSYVVAYMQIWFCCMWFGFIICILNYVCWEVWLSCLFCICDNKIIVIFIVILFIYSSSYSFRCLFSIPSFVQHATISLSYTVRHRRWRTAVRHLPIWRCTRSGWKVSSNFGMLYLIPRKFDTVISIKMHKGTLWLNMKPNNGMVSSHGPVKVFGGRQRTRTRLYAGRQRTH